jgi:arsenite methyltransferase
MDDYLSSSFDFGQAEVTALYDELPQWSALFGELLFKYVPMRHGMTVLDLGYGTGFPLLELAERLGASCKVYGVDPWDAARERALVKARSWGVRNVEILPGDAAQLSFPAEQFDLIVSNLGLNNFVDPAAAVRECWRVARPGARLALTTNLQGHMREFYEVYAETLHEMGLNAILPALEAHIAHRATVAGVTALLETAGFQLKAVHEEAAVLRYLDGSALLRHHFIRQGFLDAWKAVLAPADLRAVFERLEANLNRMASEKGELALTIPMAYIEGEKELR